MTVCGSSEICQEMWTAIFSFGLAAMNLCHNHKTVWRRQKRKNCVLHGGVINVVKGNE